MKIVVFGGSGLIGTRLVRCLRGGGHTVVAASPKTGVNAATGEGLASVVVGATVIVDVMNSPSWDDAAVLDFFQSTTLNLLQAGAAANVSHHVALSVVGTERLQESGFFRAKLAQEDLIRNSGRPFTVVRATQFFEFIGAIAAASTSGNVVRLPDALMQPMAADDVAAKLAEICQSAPINDMIEIAGPEPMGIDEAVRRLVRANDDARVVVTDNAAPYYGIHVQQRSLMPQASARLGSIRIDEWLTRRPRPAAAV